MDNYGKYNQIGDNVAGDKHVHYHSDIIQRRQPFTNKALIIPFTMSNANSAQGGTYVPRDDLLSKIEDAFKSERIVFLSGMGGCGKTELARAYGHKHREDYEEIFWLICDDETIPNLMLLLDKADLVRKIEKSDTKNFSDKVLIIVDNCNIETPSFLEELEAWTGEAEILVTTRLRNVGRFKAILLVESDMPEQFTYSVFEQNYCLVPDLGEVQKEILNAEKGFVHEICQCVQYNTMFVSLIAIYLREYSNLSITACAKKIRTSICKIKGAINYGKDQNVNSGEIKDILYLLFKDVLKFKFNDSQKRVLSLVSLTPAEWYSVEYICSLLDGLRNDSAHQRAIKSLLRLGWLQGSAERIEIHPLIAEVLSIHPNISQVEKWFYEDLLDNYIGLSDKYLGKERFLINKLLKRADKTKSEVRLTVMLLLNHGGYKNLFAEIHPEVTVAYFVYLTHDRTRYFMYRDLERNETCLLTEAPCQNDEEEALLLKVYNTGGTYCLDLNVSFHGKYIKEIAEGLCGYDPYVRKLIFPNRTEIIGNGAFSGCSGLSGELHLPENLSSIGDSAFKNCKGLSGELHLPKNISSIGDSAFEYCEGLSGELRLPENLTSIADRAFKGCRGLSGELHLPESLTSIGKSAFEGCNGFNGELHLPESLTNIGDSAFAYCNGLSGELCLPNSLTSVGKFTFQGCDGLMIPYSLIRKYDLEVLQSDDKEDDEIDLQSFIWHEKRFIPHISEDFMACWKDPHLPESLTSINRYSYSGSHTLTGTLNLPEGLKSIGDGAFAECICLSGNLHLPDSIISIGDKAFIGCIGLDGELHLPENIRIIGEEAFAGCSGLSGVLHLPESLTNIGNLAFAGCSGLIDELRLPKSLSSIGFGVFFGCSGLSGELHLPDGLTSIAESAFSGCSGFSGELRLPKNLTTIGTYAFKGCSGFSGELFLPEGLKSIGAYAFKNCSGFSGELLLPEGLTSIGEGSFLGCSGFSGELYLPRGLKGIGACVFGGCSGLSGELCLPESLTSINLFAFSGCSGFSGELHLPKGLKSIAAGAFFGCTGFSGELHLPESLKSIDICAFSGCTGFSGELHLPENLKSIDANAFSGCTGFSGELHLPESLKSIDAGAFSGCSSLSGNLYFSEKLMCIGHLAFEGCNLIEKMVFKSPFTEIKGDLNPYSSTIIVGLKQSTAETYAREHGLIFEEIEEG